jgi:hypothetical protein
VITYVVRQVESCFTHLLVVLAISDASYLALMLIRRSLEVIDV